MTRDQKQVLYALCVNNKFSLSPQEMSVVLDALNALASDIQAETAVQASPASAKGGDPAPGARD